MVINWDEMGLPERVYRPYIWCGEEHNGHVTYFREHPQRILTEDYNQSLFFSMGSGDFYTPIAPSYIVCYGDSLAISDVNGAGNGTGALSF